MVGGQREREREGWTARQKKRGSEWMGKEGEKLCISSVIYTGRGE